MNSQTETTAEIKDLVKDIKRPLTPNSLIILRDLMSAKIAIRPYNDITRNQEKEIRWKRSAGEILNDGYVYSGKACTDLTILFIALCQTLGLKTNFVKVKKDRLVHSIAEVEVAGKWYIFDVANKESGPVAGLITKECPYQDWKLWKKGKDAWDLGLVSFADIENII